MILLAHNFCYFSKLKIWLVQFKFTLLNLIRNKTNYYFSSHFLPKFNKAHMVKTDFVWGKSWNHTKQKWETLKKTEKNKKTQTKKSPVKIDRLKKCISYHKLPWYSDLFLLFLISFSIMSLASLHSPWDPKHIKKWYI